ncbi:MAG: chemotaxis protein CheW, partial [bacterium]
IILQLDHLVYGLLVDEIVSTEEIVVKPLGRHIRTVPFYSGATLLGQGEIALILDPTALAQGRISVTQNTLNAAKTSLPNAGETSDERALVFQDGEGEVFAIPLKSVMRVEHVQTKDIERIGSMDCLRKDHAKTLRLVRLGNVLPLPTPPPLGQEMFVIVPRPPYDQIGIVAGRIVDSVDFSNHVIDAKTFAAKGVLGTVQLLGRLTLVIDCESLVSILNDQANPSEVFADAQFLLTQP